MNKSDCISFEILQIRLLKWIVFFDLLYYIQFVLLYYMNESKSIYYEILQICMLNVVFDLMCKIQFNFECLILIYLLLLILQM
jgi:hypothetical protein